ncbi:MAG TPA: tetratricopeptide repeat protein, partial [Candidatus Polarisedimenticolia bacterium]|nr:tetratricopeptide repeat protein [Candidatus Polarisedimenticolia bacterium]
CAKSAGDPTGESQAWRQAVALNRGDVYAYRHYVAALKRSRGLDLERAHVLEETQSARGSGDAIPFVRLGLIEQARGEAGAARDAALEAVRADCNDVRAQRLLHDLVGYDDIGAQELLQDSRLNAGATATPGERAEVHRTRGALLLATGRPTPAEEEFRKALSADERDVRTLVAIGSLVRSGGRLDEAITMLQAARTLGPDYLYAHLDLALALEDSGRADEALAAARAAVRLAPDDPLGYSSLGVILSAKGDVAKAAEAVERAVAIDPMDQIGAPRLLLAKLYGSMGRNARARTVLKGDLPQDPDEIYDMAWRFVGETYHDRTFKGQDWRLWKDRFTGRLKTVSDSLGAVALMLSSLDDRSTRLRSADQTATLLFTERSDTTEFAPSGVALSTSKTVDSRRLADNIGYIAITNMNDPKLPTDVQKAVEEMSKTDGVILDLRGNQGGADGDIERIAGMFVKPGTETGTVVTPQGTTKSTAEPTAGRTTPIIPESKPVVVLTDHNTASSAEHLVGSLKESKRAIVVGEKTHGKSAIQVPRLLPGGTVVLVVSSEHADLKGDVYTGVGIKPNVPMEGVSSGDRTDQDPAVKKARDLIKKKPDGGR